nr:transmembrane protein 177 [Megalopta genalis]
MQRTLLQLGTLNATIALTILPHNYYLDKYRGLRAKYRMNQEEEPVKEKCQKRFEQVMDDMKLSDDRRDRLSLFHVYGYDIFSAGYYSTIFGRGVIGIPMNYEYESIKDVDKQMLFIQDKPLDWNKKESHVFLESIILSENAQKYAMAREMMKILTRDIRYETMTHAGIGALAILLFESMLYFVKVFRERRAYQVLMALFTYSGAFFTWTIIKIENNCNRDIKIDEYLLSLGSNYVKGANEFYNKLYERNKAVKLIRGDNSKSSTYMHEYLLRWNRGLSIPERQSFFNSRLQNIQQVS